MGEKHVNRQNMLAPYASDEYLMATPSPKRSSCHCACEARPRGDRGRHRRPAIGVWDEAENGFHVPKGILPGALAELSASRVSPDASGVSTRSRWERRSVPCRLTPLTMRPQGPTGAPEKTASFRPSAR